jgi:prepilin-type N-terminal cleavage/methylation domain-containing protein
MVNHPGGRTALRRRTGAAFTLLELIVVMSIIVTLSLIAMPRMSNSIALHRVESAANRIALDLKMAREHAMVTSTGQEVQFNLDDGAYTLGGLNDLERPDQAYVVYLNREPYGVELASVTMKGGATSVVFDGFGMPDTHGTVVIRLGRHQRSIIWNASNGIPQIGS